MATKYKSDSNMRTLALQRQRITVKRTFHRYSQLGISVIAQQIQKTPLDK
jgi:hypothetical protein